MPVKGFFSIEWTKPSLNNVLLIQQYLIEKFSEQEVVKLYNLLEGFENAVVNFPKLYPGFSIRKKLRRAVLNKNLSVYYSVKNNKVIVISVLDNRMDYSKLL